MTMAATDRAIVVGINHYPGILPSLNGPENDAMSFRDWLVAPDGGGVPATNVRTILSSDYDWTDDPITAEPKLDQFTDAVDELDDLGQKGQGTAGRRLYLFFAGHGFAPDDVETALLMANATRTRPGYHVAARRYADWFSVARYFEEVVLVMDCCREHFKKVPLGVCHLSPVEQKPQAKTVYAFGTKFAQASREREAADGKVRGYFTSAMLAGLRAAANQAGKVTAADLEAFVGDWFTNNAAGQPRPEFVFDHMDDNIVLCDGTAATVVVTVTLQAPTPGVEVELRDGTYALIPPTEVTGNTWTWTLGRGLYKYGITGGSSELLDVPGDEGRIDVRL
jgi:hypothetical protein